MQWLESSQSQIANLKHKVKANGHVINGLKGEKQHLEKTIEKLKQGLLSMESTQFLNELLWDEVKALEDTVEEQKAELIKATNLKCQNDAYQNEIKTLRADNQFLEEAMRQKNIEAIKMRPWWQKVAPWHKARVYAI